MSSAVIAWAFWIGPAVALYVYAIFPALLSLVAARGRRAPLEAGPAVEPPVVTVIVPAYNEERNVGARIQNLLASDYPQRRLDIVVVSDASTDRTDEIARSFAPDGVRLIVQERRSGKTAGLNRAIQIARGEIVVFTDANASFPPETVSRLVAYFADARVGLVSGYTRYSVGADGKVAEATNAYTSLERVIKRAESRWGCCVGADGAIFAMRRALYRTLRDDDINDLVLPLSVIDQGFRCLFADDAYCTEHPGENLDSEFRRQSRITNRSLRAIWRRLHLLNPLRFPAFSFFLLSHKVLRFLVPVLLGASIPLLLALAAVDVRYRLMALAAAVLGGVVAAAARGNTLALSVRPLRMLSVLVTMNLAILHGWYKFVAGRTEVTWQHNRLLSR